jgi:hypothetical protein
MTDEHSVARQIFPASVLPLAGSQSDWTDGELATAYTQLSKSQIHSSMGFPTTVRAGSGRGGPTYSNTK